MVNCYDRLVGGAGDIKLTKDGNTLLKEMVTLCSILQLYSYSRNLDQLKLVEYC